MKHTFSGNYWILVIFFNPPVFVRALKMSDSIGDSEKKSVGPFNLTSSLFRFGMTLKSVVYSQTKNKLSSN